MTIRNINVSENQVCHSLYRTCALPPTLILAAVNTNEPLSRKKKKKRKKEGKKERKKKKRKTTCSFAKCCSLI